MLFRRIAAAVGAAALLVVPGTAAQAEPSTQDAGYLRAANQVHVAEIEQGRIAWQRTSDAEVKKLAATFMRDHIHMNAALADVARQVGVRLPNVPTADQKALAGRYEAAGAAAFDELYLSTQLAAHRKARELAIAQIAKGSDPLVKKVAEASAPVLAKHQRLLRAAAN